MARRASFTPNRIPGRNLPWCVNVPAAMSETGSRERRFFATKKAAETFIVTTQNRILNHGVTMHGLNATQREAASAAFRLLEGESPSVLVEIVQHHLQLKKLRDKSVSFQKLREAFLSAKAGRSKAYLRQVRMAFDKFSTLNTANVAVMEPGDIDGALEDSPPAARNAHLRVAKAAFNFAVKKGWASTNPVTRVDFAEIRHGEVEILCNAQVTELLKACRETDPTLVPYHLFGLFAGIRPQELERMKWEHVQLREKHILLPSEVTKTGTRRVIEIEPTLAKWLRWFIKKRGKQSGNVTPSEGLRRRLRAVRKKAKITQWIQDVMRHTYASNWLATHESVDRLRANLGHRSNDVLWKHYHKAVLRKDAEQFWVIVPNLKPRSR